MDNWTGIGHIATGMAGQDYDLQLIRYDGRGWRATFHHDAMFSPDGFGAGPTPWRAVRVAAWEALGRAARS